MKHYSPQLLMTLKLYSHYRKDKSMKTLQENDEDGKKAYTRSPQKRIAKITLFKPDFD